MIQRAANVKLVAPYREMACGCGDLVNVQCGWCDAALGTHVEHLDAAGPGAEILCARCYLIGVREPCGSPGMKRVIEEHMARHMILN